MQIQPITDDVIYRVGKILVQVESKYRSEYTTFIQNFLNKDLSQLFHFIYLIRDTNPKYFIYI